MVKYMKVLQKICVICIGLATIGCAKISTKLDRSNDYQKHVNSIAPLRIPDDLKTYQKDALYPIPAVASTAKIHDLSLVPPGIDVGKK